MSIAICVFFHTQYNFRDYLKLHSLTATESNLFIVLSLGAFVSPAIISVLFAKG